MLQFLRELHFIEAGRRPGCRTTLGVSCSSFGNCTSLRHAGPTGHRVRLAGCSSFGNCTSLRPLRQRRGRGRAGLQFLRELHFIEASPCQPPMIARQVLQFLRELHFIEARKSKRPQRQLDRCSSFGNCTSLRLHLEDRGGAPRPGCSSFGNCTSLRPLRQRRGRGRAGLQFLRELHFIEAGRACR